MSLFHVLRQKSGNGLTEQTKLLAHGAPSIANQSTREPSEHATATEPTMNRFQGEKACGDINRRAAAVVQAAPIADRPTRQSNDEHLL